MKIGGVKVSRCEEVLILPRIDGDLVIKAAAVLSMDEFETLCPKPVPPTRLMAGGDKVQDFDAKDFVSVLTLWGERRYAYICIKSLEPSNIEWDKVDLKDPKTYLKWSDEMSAAGIASTELNRISNLILEANALSETKLKAAREAFLLGQGKTG